MNTAGEQGSTGVEATDIELRAFIDGWLHCYRSEDLASGREIVTPGCAENDPFYGVDHERSLISGPIKRVERIEICPGCGVWARKRRTQPVTRDVPPPRAPESDGDLPAPAGTIRGVL